MKNTRKELYIKAFPENNEVIYTGIEFEYKRDKRMKRIINLCRSKRFVIGIVIIVVILAFSFFMYHHSSYSGVDASSIEYRTDAQPIIDRFPSLPAFQSCYWKADTIGRTESIGPTNYWMEGFIVLEKDSYTQLLNAYSWKPVSMKFPPGIDPAATGFEAFSWCYNKEFDAKVRTAAFVGDFCFDTTHGILYFSLENN